MTWRLTVAFVFVLCVSGCGLAATINNFAIVDAVNAKLPSDNQFDRLNWYPTKTFRLHREYRRLYPDGRLLRHQGTLVAVIRFCIAMAAVLLGGGMLAIAWLGGGGVLLVWFVYFSLSGQTLISSVSPNGTYRVEVSQERKGVERYVYLNAYRKDQPFVRNKLLYTGDQFDDEFRKIYPAFSWVSDSILKVGQDVAETQTNELTIKNETTKPISYLLIETYRDKYVLFDVAPEAVIKLRFQFIGQLSCQGGSTEVKKGFGSAVRLLNDAEGEVQGNFLIRIEATNPIIESPNLHLKRVTCCAVDRPDINHEGV